jgi:hypothetical protein
MPEATVANNQLISRNTNEIYNKEMTNIIAEKLISNGGSLRHFYDVASIRLIQSEINAL